MKKRAISLILVICVLVFLFPTTALASELAEDGEKESYYETYTAIGDSICAGFTQPDYQYREGFAVNPENSPALCYTSLAAAAMGSKVYNLGKCGCDTNELLNILTDEDNEYYTAYTQCIQESDLITLEIGSDDLLMAVVDSILASIGVTMSHQQAMELVEPLLTGDIDGIVTCMETVMGIELSQEQIDAISAELSQDALAATLATAFESFIANYPSVVAKIRSLNPSAEVVILNYYNPYRYLSYNQDMVSGTILQLIQDITDSMNAFTQNYCQENDYLYVDISDTVTNVVDPHPSTVGHAQIAAHITDALLNTITATAQDGITITPVGSNIVKYDGALTFSIDCDSEYDVFVDGVSVGSVNIYEFEHVRADHSITAKFIPDDEPDPTEPTEPTGGTMYYETYSALGDSITAGFGLCGYCGDFSDPDDAYVAIAAQALGTVNHYNLGLLGCDSGDLLNILTEPSNPYYTQFRSYLEQSDLISIDIGSNDLTMTMLDMVLEQLGYQTDDLTKEALCELIKSLLGGMSLDSIDEALESYVSQHNISSDQLTAIFDLLQSENIEARFAAAYEAFQKNWDGIIDAIHEINPDVAIAALGYYHSNPNLNVECNGTTYYVGIGEAYHKYYDLMNAYISEGSEEAGNYVFVDTTGVELNSTVNALNMDPHPSQAGHAEIAKRLVDAVLNQINAYCNEGGAVTPSGTKTVAYGWTAAYTYTYQFTPATGYILQDVSVDGSSVNTAGSYTFSAVSEDHTIIGTFATNPDQPPAKTITGITITKAPTTVAYLEGQNFNSSGMEVTATYSDGSTAVVTGYSCEPSGVLKTSDTAVTVTYEGKTAIQPISVAANTTPTYTIQVMSPRVYTITASAGEGGSIKPSGSVNVTSGNSCTFTITANEGYSIRDVLVDGVSAGSVSSYTFDHVTAPHSIAAVFSKQTGLPYYLDEHASTIFIGFSSDISGSMKFIAPLGEKILFKENHKTLSDIAGHWGESSIVFVTEREIFVNIGNDAFSPDTGMTRAMFATVIGRLYERSYGILSTASGAQVFTDVDYADYYGAYIAWAAEDGIITGVGGGLYEPERNITRQEMAAILYRFAKFLQVTPDQFDRLGLEYTDSGDIAGWAKEAALYCQSTGILIGRDDGRFDPDGAATRAEVAALLQRFIDEIVK